MAESASPGAPPPNENAPVRTFEDWAQQKLAPVAFDMTTGRASGVVGGKRLGTTAIRNAALINAARSHHSFAIGARLTEAAFDNAIAATRGIAIR